MAGEFVHADVGGELTEAEYHALLGHVLSDQARGDLIISNSAATGLVRLVAGAEGQRLEMGADDPGWVDAGGGFTMHVIPAVIGASAGDKEYCVPMFKDTNGEPDRCVLVSLLSTTTVAVIEYKRLGNAWVFDPDDCAYDTSVTLTGTASNQVEITAFAIDSPVSSGDRVLFIAYPTSGNTFEMDSIVLTAGSSSLSVVAVTIAGANQPTDSGDTATVSIPLTTTRAMTIYEDDGHFADITESSGTYTFTYTDSRVLAIDTSINISGTSARFYSGIIIGSQVLLGFFHDDFTLGAIWEMNVSAALTQEFQPFAAGVSGSDQGRHAYPALSAIGGAFAVAAPIGGDGADGQRAGYLVTSFPLDDL